MILLLTALSDPTNLHLCREKRSVQNDKMHALPMHVLSLEMHCISVCCVESQWQSPSITHASTIRSSYRTLRKWRVSGHANRNRISCWGASTWITLLVPLPSSHWSPYGFVSSKIGKSVVLNSIFKDYVLD